MEVIPGAVQKLWNVWGIRGMVILSLLSQIILTLFGSWRKKKRSIIMRLFLWSAYMLADWVAKFSLSGMATINEEDCKDDISRETIILQSFWAPFLLLHLGGPDTITAYSMEDNDLWVRGFLGLFAHVGLGIYVLLSYWSNTALSFLTLPVLFTGVIKYAERIWALRSKSLKYFRDSLLSAASSSPSLDVLTSTPAGNNQEDNFFRRAYSLYKVFAYLFLNLFISPKKMKKSYDLIRDKPLTEVYELVETELGLMYDVLYTKATLVFSPLGILVRCVSFFSLLATLIVFSLTVDLNPGYQGIDIAITYSLLSVAVILEVCSFLIIISVDWPKIWLNKRKPSSVVNATCLAKFTCCDPVLIDLTRWSRTMGQCSLISLCVKDASSRISFRKLLYIEEQLKKHYDVEWIDIEDDLLKATLKSIEELKRSLDSGEALLDELLARRGDYALKRRGVLDKLGWSILKADFDYSLLIWHVATDLCYHKDLERRPKTTKKSPEDLAKCLSDYMLYLLVTCPSLLPIGNGEMTYRKTCAEATKVFHVMQWNKEEVYSRLLEIDIDSSSDGEEEEDEIDTDQSVLIYGHGLAKHLHSFELKADAGGYERKWEMINEIWLEMFTYAVCHSEWKEHTQQLRRGGELLTHVRLLMAHLGLTEQMSQAESKTSPPMSPHTVPTP